MAPGADAVRLIHSQGNQLPGCRMLLQHRADGLPLEAFRGEIQEAQRSITELRKDLPSSVWINAAMQAGCSDSPSPELQHLILHQGHQRRNHHRKPGAHERRKLIAQRFSSTGGKNGQTVLALQQTLHDRTLTWTEVRPAVMAVQRIQEQIQGTPQLVVPAYRAPDLVDHRRFQLIR